MEITFSGPMAILRTLIQKLLLFALLLIFGLLSACGGKTDETAVRIDQISKSTTTTTTTLPDTVAPVAIAITTPAANPYASNESSLTISGTCEPAAQVRLTGDDTQTVTCTNAGTFSVIVSKSVDASYVFQFKQLDLALNTSPTATFTWNRNSGVPAPVITNPSDSPVYSGLNSLTISGTCVTGNTIRMSGASTQNMVCAGSVFSFTVSSSVDGSSSYNLLQEDAMALTSPSTSQIWVRDTAAPSAPVIASPTANPYTSADSTFNLSGSCETGSTVALSGASTGSQICGSNAFSFPVSQSTDGTYDFVLKQTDLAGNISTNTNFRWIRDNSIPATPVIASPSTNPFYSNADNLAITGSCVTGNDVLLTGAITSAQTCSNSTFNFPVSETVDATYAFAVSQRNPNTMISSASAGATWIRDTVAPSSIALSSPSSSPTYSSSNLSLIGSCETGATVKLTGDDVQNAVCANSTFSFTVVKSVDQSYSFGILQTDLAGNSSSSVAQVWVRDSNLPPAPTLSSPASNPYNSNSNNLTISGGCTTGFTVTLGGNITSGEVITPAGSLTQVCASSTYSFSVQKGSDGTFNFTLKQTSLSSIDSSNANLKWNLDTTAPQTSFSLTPSDPNLGTSATFNFSSTETGTFSCSLDGAAYTTCASPYSSSTLSNGSHTLNVKATDTFGNSDATPATYTWTQLSGKTLALYHLDSVNPTLDSGSYISPYQNNLTNSATTNNPSGKFSQSRSFSGSSQSLAAPHSASLAQMTQRMTAEAFVQLSGLPSSRVSVISKMGASGQFGWELGIKKQGSNYRLSFLGSLDGTTTTEIQSSNLTAAQETSLTAGYVHVAVTWDQGSVKLYFDGVQVATGTIGAGVVSLFNNSSTALTLGASNGTQFLNGSLDEVRISQVVRWTTTFTPPSSAYTAD
jgi:hypothetical protein